MDERQARMALCALGHLGAPKLVELVEQEGPEWVWQALVAQGEDSAWSRRAQQIDPSAIAADTQRCGSRFVTPEDDEWPAGLEDLAAAEVGGQAGKPFGLWVRGEPLTGVGEAVAIVGARAATQYGQNVALELAADLAAEGRPIVSGLAFGIDASAHRGALSVGGATIAVVASGVDKPYPSANAGLATMISRRGSIVSEFPPGHHPTRPAFLARNRLIAALASGVVVVEAALRSGAKNTAAWANELGRVVMAVPGPVTSSMSQTPHRLIRDGQAVLVTDSRDVRQLLAPVGEIHDGPSRGEDRAFDSLPRDQQALREAIPVGSEVSTGWLARRTGLTMPECLSGLQQLQARGWVEVGDGGGWRLPVAPGR